MTPAQALALAEALTRAAREAIEAGFADSPLRADAISSQTREAVSELGAAIAARG